MGDFYKLLDLKREASDSAVKQAYRQKSIQWHPQRNAGKNPEFVGNKFRQVAEAYTVLADAKLRAIYDQYGEKGLKRGAPNGNGGYVRGWVFNLNPEDIFSSFFGSSSPFAEFFDQEEGLKLFDDPNAVTGPTKMDTQEINLWLSLEELYSGCRKASSAYRQKLGTDGVTVTPEKRTLTVEVQPGWREGTKITFQGEGDEGKGLETGDVVFVLKELPHPRFRRSKDNLLYTADITLRESLTGTTVEIRTLDNRSIPIPITNIVSPSFTQVVKGEGMPMMRNPSQRGDLIIDFRVTFPSELSEVQKAALADIL
jgi:DnaJ family protein B protein 13